MIKFASSQLGLLIVFASLAVICKADPAPFSQCSERVSTAKNVSVDVGQCGSSTRCNLLRGSNASFSLRFTPQEDSANGLERAIIALFPGKNKTIEVPYGSSMDITNSTVQTSDGQQFTSVKNDVSLTHNYLFPVLKGAPEAKLFVRYIIREKFENVARNQKHWKLHPGKVYVCIDIPVQLV